jgi:hypothetical protein
MQNGNIKYRLSMIFLALSLSLHSNRAFADTANLQSAQKAAIETAALKVGRPELRIQKNLDISFNIQSYKDNTLNGLLVSIDGVPTRGKTVDDLNRLLLGPLDSEVELTYLTSSHDLMTRRVKRTALRKLSGIADRKDSLLSLVGDLDYGYALGPMGPLDHQSLSTSDELNLDLRMRANIKQWLDAPAAPFNLKPSKLPTALMNAIVYSDQVGDLTSGDKYLNEFIAAGDYNQRFWPSWNSIVGRLIIDLANSDRRQQGETAVAGLLASARSRAGSSNFNSEDYQNFCLAVLKFYASQHSSKLPTALRAYEAEHKPGQRQSYFINEGEDWLAKVYQAAGEDDKAEAAYAGLLNSRNIKSQQKGKVDFNSALLFIDYTIQTASAQAKLGKFGDAIATDTEGLKTINDLLTDEQLILTEKVGSAKVARSDIELQLADLYQQQKKSAESANFNKAAKEHLASASNGQTSSIKQNPALSDREIFAILRECTDAGRKKNVGALKKNVARLLDAYANAVADYDSNRPSINLFCCLSAQARVLADLSAFDESNKLLDSLKALGIKEATPVALGFLAVEKALNSELKGQANASLFSQINNEFEGPYCDLINAGNVDSDVYKKIKALFCTQENFRRLAVIYSKSGDLKRSAILLRRATEANDELRNMAGSVKNFDTIQLTLARIVLFLDDARMKALQGNFKVAHDTALQAVKLCSGAAPHSREQTQAAFSEAYKCKIVELAKLFDSSEKARAAVPPKSFLEFALAESNKGAACDAPVDKARPRLDIGYNSIIPVNLAQLYLRDKEYKKAYSVVEPLLQTVGKEPKFNLSMTIAEVCRANENYKAATHFYGKAEEWNHIESSNYGTLDQVWARQILERAVACAEKASDLSAGEKTNIFLRYATAIEADDFDKAMEFYKKAYDLTPDSDPGKARLLQRMENAKMQLENKKQMQKAAAAPVATVSSKPTDEEQAKLVIANAKKEIDQYKTKLRLAETSHSAEIWSLWLQLALTEANAQVPAAAFEDAKKGIALYYRGPLAMYTHSLRNVLYIAMPLTDQNKKADADALMIASVNKVESIFGKDSPQYAAQVACQASLAIYAKEYDIGLKLIDESLKCSPRALNLRVYCDSILDILNQAQYYATKNGRVDVSLKIWDKIIDAQKRGLSADDIRLKESLSKRAEARAAAGDTEGALADEKAAIEISKLYEGDLKADSLARQVLPPLLKKLGRDKEAAEIAAAVVEPKNYVDPQYPYEHNRIIPTKDASTEEQIQQLQAELKEAQKQAPFSFRSSSAAQKLLRIGEQTKNLNLIRECAILQCNSYEHHDDTNAGINFGCTPGVARTTSYVQLIKTDMLLNKKDEALATIKRALAVMPELSYSENVEFGMLAVQCQDKNLASKFANQAEQLLPLEDYIYKHRQNLNNLWTALGEPERALKTEERQNEIIKSHDARYNKMMDSPFAHTGI